MSIQLKSVGTPAAQHNFYSGDYDTNTSRRPQLVLDYIDNTDGILPPAQPFLTYPADGAVLYDTGARLLSPDQTPTLSWGGVANATGYIVTISTLQVNTSTSPGRQIESMELHLDLIRI